MDEEEYQWDAKAAIEALDLERQLFPEETDEQLSQRLLREALPIAVQAMVDLACNAEHIEIKFRAAWEIMERSVKTPEDALKLKAAWNEKLAKKRNEAA